LKECKLRGIDPKGPSAPKSIQEAVELFFEIKNADFRDLQEKKDENLPKHSDDC